MQCQVCRHELLLAEPVAESMIVNDRLDNCAPGKLNALDRFKRRVVRLCRRSNAFLLDVGSASGRFLHQNREEFRRLAGIEVTPECIAFSRGLGLEIVSSPECLDGAPSLITFWHSLEHIPADAAGTMLRWIRGHAEPDTRLIVSVPNAGSLQARLFRERFAFHDAPHHLHQYSLESLDRLMDGYGFERTALFRSFSYASFGWLQGFLNLCNSRHDYFYYRRKRGWDFGLSPAVRFALDVYNLALISLFLLPSLVMTLFDLALVRYGGVVTACYQPKPLSK